jgi:hypothetical protein
MSASVGTIHGIRGSSTEAAVIVVPPLQDEGGGYWYRLGSTSDVEIETDVGMAVQAVYLESVHPDLDMDEFDHWEGGRMGLVVPENPLVNVKCRPSHAFIFFAFSYW